MRFALALLAVVSAVVVSPATAFWSSESKTNEQAKGNLENTRGDGQADVSYGVDVSFPIHHERISTNFAWLPHNIDTSIQTPRPYEGMVVQPLGDRQKFYDDFLQSCKDHFGAKGAQRCLMNERDRIAMSLRQPQSMTNYTDIGFKKIRAPEKMFKLIKEFWDKNRDNGKPENWGTGNTYTNNWQSMTLMVSVEDTKLRGGGAALKQSIWDAGRDTIQEWTGQELTQCSLYGIRVYKGGSILATHVDRLPLVSSAIINVDQDVDEPWPLEVYGHDGKATNVTMMPGDMVLYESHSVLHGRPFPLKGRFMANIFIHFEPTGHSLRHDAKMAALENEATDVHTKYKEATARGVGGHEIDQVSGVPSYIIPGSAEEANWLLKHPNKKRSVQRSFATGSTNAHYAAQTGDLVGLQKLIEKDSSLVHSKDANGWTPLHEGARAGNKEIVKFLFEKGANVNERTDSGVGGTALWWAKKQYGKDHEIVSFLESLGAQDLGPEL